MPAAKSRPASTVAVGQQPDDSALAPVIIDAPPSFGRQMAQLVIIPAVIVLISIGVVAMLGFLVRSPDTVDQLLDRLRGSSGMGRTASGLQDPRYLERCRAAQDLATRIPRLTDPEERQRVHVALVETLDQTQPGKDVELQQFLLLAIGVLGEKGGLAELVERLDAPDPQIVEGAVGGVLAWPDTEAARAAVPGLLTALKHESPIVRAQVAAALGKLASRDDPAAIEALAAAMQVVSTEERDVMWNAGVALAKLGDSRGVTLVTGVLLNREALAKLPAAESGPQTTKLMPPVLQDRVMVHTLANVMSSDDSTVTIHMDAPAIWSKIAELAEKDTSPAVRRAAAALLDERPDAAP